MRNTNGNNNDYKTKIRTYPGEPRARKNKKKPKKMKNLRHSKTHQKMQNT